MASKYTFTDYCSGWPLAFEREAAGLQSLLGDELVALHHIGSTSVPGLPAKPIIDILPEVRNIERIDSCVGSLQSAGYKAWGEYGIVGRRYFTKDHGVYRSHNIHMYQQGNPEIERHLAFCAYLRHHATTRNEYAELKRRVYARHPADIEAYNDGKDQWIKQVEGLALEWWYRQRADQSELD